MSIKSLNILEHFCDFSIYFKKHGTQYIFFQTPIFKIYSLMNYLNTLPQKYFLISRWLRGIHKVQQHFLVTKGSKSDEKVMTDMHKNVLTYFMNGPLPSG